MNSLANHSFISNCWLWHHAKSYFQQIIVLSLNAGYDVMPNIISSNLLFHLLMLAMTSCQISFLANCCFISNCWLWCHAKSHFWQIVFLSPNDSYDIMPNLIFSKSLFHLQLPAMTTCQYSFLANCCLSFICRLWRHANTRSGKSLFEFHLPAMTSHQNSFPANHCSSFICRLWRHTKTRSSKSLLEFHLLAMTSLPYPFLANCCLSYICQLWRNANTHFRQIVVWVSSASYDITPKLVSANRCLSFICRQRRHSHTHFRQIVVWVPSADYDVMPIPISSKSLFEFHLPAMT